MQMIVVYIVIALALIGACRYGYRKIQALKKDKNCADCTSCPLKDKCSKPPKMKKGKSCCCS